MNELDLKEIIYQLLDRIQMLEKTIETPYSDNLIRSDEYITKVLESIREGA